MRSVICLFGLLFGMQCSIAQKLVKKSIVKPNITYIQLDVNNCFQLDLKTWDKEDLLVEAQIDGEYQKDLLLNVFEVGSTLKINTDFQPNFVKPNDKLSTHKVISIALKVRVPNQKKVDVYGTNCNVSALGEYQFLKVILNDGRCDLINISEAVAVTTQSGHISAKYSQAMIKAKSKYGAVRGVNSEIGNNTYDLSTITGDILLERIE